MSVFIIAEVGSVHDGSFGNAQRLIDVAAKCGVDAVKFQTHIPAAETLHDAPMPPYFRGEPRYAYFERTGFSRQQWHELKVHAVSQGIEFLSSPFSNEAVELLEDVGISRYKIPSGEVTNLPLLEVVAKTGKPVLLSSGMSSWDELDEAVNTILRYHRQITVLQCTSEYPCSYENVGLNIMQEMRQRYEVPVGLSDHTLTPYAALAAVTLGAAVIEKHLAFSRLMYGSDAMHSHEPGEFQQLVEGIRAIEKMKGAIVDKNVVAGNMGHMKDTFQKSIVSRVAIPKGTVINADHLAFKKPGTGIPTNRLGEIIGLRSTRDVPADVLLQESDFS